MKLKNDFIIIIPVWNAKKFIQEAINSVINQNYDNLGIISREDLSTDGTYSIIQDLLKINGTYFKVENKIIVKIGNASEDDKTEIEIGDKTEKVVTKNEPSKNNISSDNLPEDIKNDVNKQFSSLNFNISAENKPYFILLVFVVISN